MRLLQVDETVDMTTFAHELVFSVAVPIVSIQDILLENDPVKRNSIAAQLGDKLIEYFKTHREPVKLPQVLTLMQRVKGV